MSVVDIASLAAAVAQLPGIQAAAVAPVENGIAGAPLHRGIADNVLLMERSITVLEASVENEAHIFIDGTTILVRDFETCVVAVCYPRGHLVAKSIQRMLRRAVARASKSKAA